LKLLDVLKDPAELWISQHRQPSPGKKVVFSITAGTATFPQAKTDNDSEKAEEESPIKYA